MVWGGGGTPARQGPPGGSRTASTTLKERFRCGDAAEMGQHQQQPQQQPRRLPLDDTHDAQSPQPDTPVPAWAPVLSRLHLLGLNRQHRLTACILREAIWCGALRAYIGHCRQQLSLAEASVQAACLRPACQGQPETHTHLFVICPLSAFLALPASYFRRCYPLWVFHALILNSATNFNMWRSLL